MHKEIQGEETGLGFESVFEETVPIDTGETQAVSCRDCDCDSCRSDGCEGFL